MNRVEIRRNKRIYIWMSTFFIICLSSFSIYWIISGSYKGRVFASIVQILAFIFSLFQAKNLWRNLKRNEPVLVLNDTHIIISDDGEESFLWEEICSYHLKEDDGGSYLVLETLRGVRNVSLIWLDKSPKEITTYLSHHLKKQTT